jgi:uncharacterized protein
MKYLYSLIIFICLLFIPNYTFAYTPPARNQFITDTVGKLSTSNVDDLNKKLLEYQNKTGKTIAVLIIQELDGESIEDVAYTTFNIWKIGQKDKDTGVLLVLSLNDRKSRIEVGKGLEGDLTDSESSSILRNVLATDLKKGDFNGGITNTIASIQKELGSEITISAISSTSSEAESAPPIIIFFVILAIFAVVVISSLFGSTRRRGSYYSGGSWSSGGNSSGTSRGSSSGSWDGGSSGGGGASGGW